MTNQTLTQFREGLYRALPRRADATVDLIDALAANTRARSVVELSLSPWFRRGHASVHDAIDALLANPGHSPIDGPRRRLEGQLLSALLPVLPPPTARPFWLVALDGLALARPHARTLADRSYVHSAEGGRAGAPVVVGHAYSLLVALPERGSGEPPWAPILSSRRVPSKRSAADVGVEQLWDLLAAEAAPWAGGLVVCVADSGYGNAPFLADAAAEPNLVVVTRLRSQRVLYRQPVREPGRRGRPAWYGSRFDLAEEATWPTPDSLSQLQRQTHRGRCYTVTVSAWRDLLMKGSRPYPMHARPFTLLRVVCHDQTAQPLWAPLWLAVVGERRDEIDAEAALDAYRQRFDQEHCHRFLRQRLLVDAFATPDTQHEENWLAVVRLAYGELFAARSLAEHLPRPWERHRSQPSVASPTMVQRNMDGILATVGTPAAAPQPRGKSPGRQLGDAPGRRKVRPVVFKGQDGRPRARAPAA